MQIKDSKYHKVWKKKEQNGFTKLDLGDSKKNKDGSYTNWSWFNVTVLGNAKNVEVNEGDTIEIKSGIVSKRKYNDKYYDDVIIFEMEIMKKGENNSMAKHEESDFIPF